VDDYVVTAKFVVKAPSAEVARMFTAIDVNSVVEADQAMPLPPGELLFGGCGYRGGIVCDDVEPVPVNLTLFLPFERQAD
jgi:hypothetical protein